MKKKIEKKICEILNIITHTKKFKYKSVSYDEKAVLSRTVTFITIKFI